MASRHLPAASTRQEPAHVVRARHRNPAASTLMKARMMTIKHLIAGAVVTVAVTSALVLGGAVGAQAQIFPTPTPIGPGSVNKPIYTQPNYPGFHAPSQLWTKYPWFQVKPSAPTPFSVLPANCPATVSRELVTLFAMQGYIPTGDTTVHATSDPQLLALLSHASRTITCQWVNRTGGIVNLTDAIGIDDGAVAARLHALGFTDPGPIHGYQYFADGTSYDQAVMPARGGWTLVSTSGSANDVFGLIMQDGQDHLWAVNS
ncbi:MAG: hypothetical protein ABIS08_02220 [Pseudolysinimonas sp.]